MEIHFTKHWTLFKQIKINFFFLGMHIAQHSFKLSATATASFSLMSVKLIKM